MSDYRTFIGSVLQLFISTLGEFAYPPLLELDTRLKWVGVLPIYDVVIAGHFVAAGLTIPHYQLHSTAVLLLAGHAPWKRL